MKDGFTGSLRPHPFWWKKYVLFAALLRVEAAGIFENALFWPFLFCHCNELSKTTEMSGRLLRTARSLAHACPRGPETEPLFASFLNLLEEKT